MTLSASDRSAADGQWAIDAEDLQKSYGGRPALVSVDLQVAPGRSVALIGPNGAGKSTLVEILMGLRKPDAGRVRVLGHDVLADPRGHVSRLGVQLQETRLFDKATSREYFQLFSGLYPRSLDHEALAEQLQLTSFLDRPLAKLSGGQRQRVALGLAMINDPDLIILDEPTVGLDPIARQGFWDLIEQLRAQRKTLLFSTHYMEEAQALADDIAMISDGRIVARGTAGEIIEQSKLGAGASLDDAYRHFARQSAGGVK